MSYFSTQAENEMSIEDLIAKYGCGVGAEDAEDGMEDCESEEVEDEGKTVQSFLAAWVGNILCGAEKLNTLNQKFC